MIHPGSGADSVRALTWYWAAEWYYDIQDYDKSIEYAGKALASSRKAGTKEIECDDNDHLWSAREKSFGGIGSGILLFIVGTILLWWNEAGLSRQPKC